MAVCSQLINKQLRQDLIHQQANHPQGAGHMTIQRQNSVPLAFVYDLSDSQHKVCHIRHLTANAAGQGTYDCHGPATATSATTPSFEDNLVLEGWVVWPGFDVSEEFIKYVGKYLSKGPTQWGSCGLPPAEMFWPDGQPRQNIQLRVHQFIQWHQSAFKDGRARGCLDNHCQLLLLRQPQWLQHFVVERGPVVNHPVPSRCLASRVLELRMRFKLPPMQDLCHQFNLNIQFEYEQAAAHPTGTTQSWLNYVDKHLHYFSQLVPQLKVLHTVSATFNSKLFKQCTPTHRFGVPVYLLRCAIPASSTGTSQECWPVTWSSCRWSQTWPCLHLILQQETYVAVFALSGIH